ncbi:MAG: PhzF family phenazine biosynthesis protein [Acidobacteriota bacterium]
MRYRYYTADVFTTSRFGGNQLAVITDAVGPDAVALTTHQMQQIAREFNYSETVFILPARDTSCLCRLRIFTPDEELPFAGHPTIGAAFILARTGRLDFKAGRARVLLEEGAGPVPVEIDAEGDGDGAFHATLTAPQLPVHRQVDLSITDLARLIGVDPSEILTGHFSPEAVSCGLPFLFIPLSSLAAIGRVVLDLEVWRRSLAGTWAPMLALFSFGSTHPGADLHVRVLCPGLGITEDPATGSAAAALGGYLASRHSLATGSLRWTIEQGIEMGRPSSLEIAVDKLEGSIVAVRVGGSAVAVMNGEIEV